MIKRVIHSHLGPIWYHPEPSDVPYSPNQFLGWDFFYPYLQQDGSNKTFSANKTLLVKYHSDYLSVH